VSLLLSLAAAEIGLRWLVGKPWYERVVDEQTGEVQHIFPVGGYRFWLRSAPVDTPKAPGAFRIYFFGDSFTYGQGLGDSSQSFVQRTVALLNERRPLPGVQKFEAFNGGMPGSLTPQWVKLSSATLKPYDPDLVVVVFFLRDGLAGVTSIAQINHIRDGMRQVAKDSFLFRHSRLYQLCVEGRRQSELSRKYLAEMHEGYLGDAPSTRQWQRAQADLLEIERQASAIGSQMALVIFPVLFELNDDYPLRDVCDEIERFCHANGIPVHSLLPAFLGQKADTLWNAPYDQHPNASGHEIAARGLYPFIEERIRARVKRKEE